MALRIGVTGGIGCGKSTVAGLFAKHGAAVIDTDEISRRLTQAGGAAIESIRAAFGNDFISEDGAMDRTKMRKRVFSDSIAKRRLELILHPLILDQAKEELQKLEARPYVIIVVPLLPESAAFRNLVQRVLVVDCDEKIQLARVTKRSGMTEAEVRRIIAEQTPRAERLKISDDVVHNDAGLDSLARQVAGLHARYSSIQNSI